MSEEKCTCETKKEEFLNDDHARFIKVKTSMMFDRHIEDIQFEINRMIAQEKQICEEEFSRLQDKIVGSILICLGFDIGERLVRFQNNAKEKLKECILNSIDESQKERELKLKEMKGMNKEIDQIVKEVKEWAREGKKTTQEIKEELERRVNEKFKDSDYHVNFDVQ